MLSYTGVRIAQHKLDISSNEKVRKDNGHCRSERMAVIMDFRWDSFWLIVQRYLSMALT
jgi:hypothetical protein